MIDGYLGCARNDEIIEIGSMSWRCTDDGRDKAKRPKSSSKIKKLK